MTQQTNCPLCDCTKDPLPVTITDTDQHISEYGNLYDGYTISQWAVCADCGFPRPTTKSLDDYYKAGLYHKTRDEPEAKLELDQRYDGVYHNNIEWIQSKISLKTGNVFDVGCGFDYFLSQWKDRDWVPYGIEPDQLRVN